MANPVPVCAHVKTDGVRCGSPAVSGTELCYHHSAVKTTLGKAPSGKAAYGAVTPIPFLFPEDRASIQVNYFLLFQAFMDGRIERRDADLMFRMLKEMRVNLGKTGSLVEEDRAQGSEHRAQEGGEEAVSRKAVSGGAASRETVSDQESSEPASEKRDVGTRDVGGESRTRSAPNSASAALQGRSWDDAPAGLPDGPA